jgi:hypothetical protein
VAKPPLPDTVGVEIDSACDYELWIDGELVAVDPIAGGPQIPLSFQVVARYPMSIEARLTDANAASDLRVRVGGHELPRSAWQVAGGEGRAGALVLSTVFDHVHGSHADPTDAGRSTPASTAIPARPNIILLLSDDQGWSGLSTPMHPELPGATSDRIRTPNIATLGRDGMRPSARRHESGSRPARTRQHSTGRRPPAR